MEQTKSNSEIVAEIYRNAQLALTSISESGLDLKEPGPIKKAMMWSAIKMGTASDNSAQNIAQMMIRGTVNGITSLKTTLTDGGKTIQPDVRQLLTELISVEESFEKRLKKFL